MTDLPEGFLFQPEFLSEEDEAGLLAIIQQMDLQPFQMHGVWSKRRIAHLGYRYSFTERSAMESAPIPEAFLPLRDRLAGAVSVAPEELAEALVTEYSTGAGIGWHRDAPMFGIVAAVSLLGSCRMRFQRGKNAEREVREIELTPRSMYAITGTSRSEWQHSIPATKTLRYSITFRTLRRRARQK